MSEVEGGAAKVVTTKVKDGEVVQTERELSATEVQEMDSAIERVMDNVQSGRPEGHTAAPADPYDVAGHREEVLQGRDKDKDGYWKQVMEHHGWNWIEPEQLDRVVGPQRVIPSKLNDVTDRYGREIYNNRLYWTRSHAEGQWRPDIGKRRPHPALRQYSFTMADLVANYGTPQAFAEWCGVMVRKWEKVRSRIKVAPRRR